MDSVFAADPSWQTLVIVMGDLVSSGDKENPWTHELFSRDYPSILTLMSSMPYQSCLGNHDIDGKSTLFPKYFPYPFAGEWYYSFDYGPAHFTVVDQYEHIAAGSPEHDWIRSDLAGSSKPWKFLYMHEPAWSAGNHENNVPAQLSIIPLCERYRVAIVFAGHNHYYSRAVLPLTSGGAIQNITTGGGGAPLTPPDSHSPFIVAAAEEYHYCRVDILSDSLLRFEAWSVHGKLLDSFTIDRTKLPPDSDPWVQPVIVYPDPFTSYTTFSYTLVEPGRVSVRFFSTDGHQVDAYNPGYQEMGRHAFQWQAGALPAGVYLYSLEVNGRSYSGRLIKY